MSSPAASRIASFDYFKVWAAFAIVIIHANTFGGVAGMEGAYTLLRNFVRFAVPFFFLVSGYLFAMRVESKGLPSTLWRFIKHAAVLLVVWSLLYHLLPPAILLNAFKGDWATLRADWIKSMMELISPQTDYVKLLIEGGKYHLWFFPALIMGALLWSVMLAIKAQRNALVWAAVFFILGLVLVSRNSPLKLPISFSWGNGPFWAASMFAFASWARQTGWKPLGGVAWFIFVVGFAVRWSEVTGGALWLFGTHANPADAFQFSVGPTLMALGLFGVALAKPEFGQRSWLQKLAPYTTAIYLVHVFWIDSLSPLVGQSIPWWVWQPVFPVVVLLLSAACGWLLKRSKATAWLVE